jgi:hypothetical protein
MSNPTIDALIAQIEATKQVEASATVLINGFAARIQTAVDTALAGGASAADLAPITDELTAIKAATDDLSAAVVANTPAATPPPGT